MELARSTWGPQLSKARWRVGYMRPRSRAEVDLLLAARQTEEAAVALAQRGCREGRCDSGRGVTVVAKMGSSGLR